MRVWRELLLSCVDSATVRRERARRASGNAEPVLPLHEGRPDEVVLGVPALLPAQAMSSLDQGAKCLADLFDVAGRKDSQIGERQLQVRRVRRERT